MSDIPRGTIFGRQAGNPPKNDAEHFIRCPASRRLDGLPRFCQVFEHEGPLRLTCSPTCPRL